MFTRHQEVPVLSEWPDKVDARHYNIVRRAIARIGPEIRLSLPGLKTLQIILQEDAWIIVDRAFNDIPIAAWVSFQPAQDRGLHESVPCELRYYHGHAGMITKQVLGLMDELLDALLSEGDQTHQVIAFPGKE